MAKIVNIKPEPDMPAVTGRNALANAISELKRKRSALLVSVGMLDQADANITDAATKLEDAGKAVTAARAADTADAVGGLRKGLKGAVGTAAIKQARQYEDDCRDSFDVATAAKASVHAELITLAEAAALADNAVHVERNRLIANFIKDVIAEGEKLRRQVHVCKCVLTALITTASEVPPLDHQDQISVAARAKCAAEREAVVAADREAARLFLATNLVDTDRSTGEAAAQRLRAQLNQLLEDPSIELLEIK